MATKTGSKPGVVTKQGTNTPTIEGSPLPMSKTPPSK
jgi:hypothetical protein